MAKNGFRLIDAEMHVMEPVDLWQRYIDPEFRERAARRVSATALATSWGETAAAPNSRW